jgi:hypothetical protein
VACLAAGGAKPPKSNLTIGHYLRWCKHSNYNWMGTLDWTTGRERWIGPLDGNVGLNNRVEQKSVQFQIQG